MWRWLTILLASALLFAACTDDNEPDEKDSEEDLGPTAGLSKAGNTYGIFPSDAYTVASEQTFTGRKVQLELDSKDPLMRELPTSSFTLPFLNELDGFGTSAGGWVRFTERVDAGTVVDGETAFFGYLLDDEVVLVPSETIAEYDQVAFRPHLPLPSMAPAFFATTKGIKSRDGEDFAATHELAQILEGTYDGEHVTVDADLAARMDGVAQGLVDAGHISSKDDLNALSAFTTQSIHQTSLEIAEKIRAYEPAISMDNEPCETIEQDNVRRCFVTITVRNFINDDDTISDDAADTDLSADNATYELRATIHLPLEDAETRAAGETGVDQFIPGYSTNGYPVAIFGHGLTGDGTQAKDIAKYIAPMGIATIGVDSPQHGTHPTTSHPDETDLDLLQALFGIDIDGSKINVHPFKLRDGWRQSNLDKLGLIEAIKKGIDIDGDDVPDLDADRISYLGASLGSIQGPELIAVSPDIELALLAIGGARISDFLRYDGLIQLIAMLVAPNVKADAFMRFLVVLQIAVEKGDGVNWAPHVLQNRLHNAGDPMHVAMQMSIPDEIVPMETGVMQTRAMGVPIIGYAELPDDHLENIAVVEEPLSENHDSGMTAGVIQIHQMHKMNALDEWRETSHASSPDSLEALTYWKHIFHTMYFDDSRVPSLIDPYHVLGEEPPSHFEP